MNQLKKRTTLAQCMKVINDSAARKVFVQYKFKNHGEEYGDVLTMTQYRNLGSLPNVEYCKIIESYN